MLRYSLLALTLVAANAMAVPRLERVQDSSDVISLLGAEFGEACNTCEVIADYGGLHYTLPLRHWSDQRIDVQLPDLNLNTRISLWVQTPGGRSNALPHELRRVLQPPQAELRFISSPSPALQVFSADHRLKIGDKGESGFDVSSRPLACEEKGLVFESARIALGQVRFGAAEIIAAPASGCIHCAPVKVRWYHEPTGYLQYQVQITRRQVEGLCPARKR